MSLSSAMFSNGIENAYEEEGFMGSRRFVGSGLAVSRCARIIRSSEMPFGGEITARLDGAIRNVRSGATCSLCDTGLRRRREILASESWHASPVHFRSSLSSVDFHSDIRDDDEHAGWLIRDARGQQVRGDARLMGFIILIIFLPKHESIALQ